MLLIVRIVTIIVSLAWLLAGTYLGILGLNDTPEKDWEAVAMGGGIILFFVANLYLLYRSYKKKHTPTTWVAFILAVLPAIAFIIFLWAVDALD